ncbi:MAG: dienelactone hydrolase family protein, partial [Anaerolineales bacterium]|nr:dienelactone hydrolase family protein [Anaerolineales bacterium]
AEEFAEEYEEGRLSRREALQVITSVTGSVVLANSFLAACTPPPTEATPEGTDSAAAASATPTTEEAPRASPTVEPDDPGIEAGPVSFPVGDDEVMAYLARPSGSGPFPVVLVSHENRGLTEHIRDVTRRLADAGYVALAVDLLSRQGGSETVGEASAPGALGQIDPEQFAEDFIQGWQYLQEQPYADTDRVGMVGFCFGGGVTWLVATRMPELKAAVPFYGPHPPVEEVPNINAPVLGIYAENDGRINQGITAIEEAMAANNKIYEKIIYPDADHAFHNDTGSRYVPEAAMDAWQQTLAWFDEYLKDES